MFDFPTDKNQHGDDLLITALTRLQDRPEVVLDSEEIGQVWIWAS